MAGTYLGAPESLRGFGTCESVEFVGWILIDGTHARDPLNGTDIDVLRAGTLLGRITASGKYAPSVLGILSQAAAASATTVNVSAAVASEIVHRIGRTGSSSSPARPPPRERSRRRR